MHVNQLKNNDSQGDTIHDKGKNMFKLVLNNIHGIHPNDNHIQVTRIGAQAKKYRADGLALPETNYR
jgi:hypothetical protein